MNLIGRTFKVINWLLLGKDNSLKDLAIRVIEELKNGAEIEFKKDGIFLRYKKEL